MKTTVMTRGGEEIAIDEWQGDTDETLAAVLGVDVLLDPLEPEEKGIDPHVFSDEMAAYVKDTLKLKAAPEVVFEEKGMIGEVAYWVFSSTPKGESPVYAMLVRNECVSELICVPVEMELDGEQKSLSPAQAALWDYCVTEYRRPTC
ncbi:MAG: hypothetical protein PWP23_598 [Candidatus Sumerlaeota bacterium]|nr:hypothetical protein [Candidatus Sumerlaeota bacterium]